MHSKMSQRTTTRILHSAAFYIFRCCEFGLLFWQRHGHCRLVVQNTLLLLAALHCKRHDPQSSPSVPASMHSNDAARILALLQSISYQAVQHVAAWEPKELKAGLASHAPPRSIGISCTTSSATSSTNGAAPIAVPVRSSLVTATCSSSGFNLHIQVLNNQSGHGAGVWGKSGHPYTSKHVCRKYQ